MKITALATELLLKSMLILCFLVSLPLKASSFNKEDFALPLGAQASSLLYKKGIITYQRFFLHLERELLLITNTCMGRDRKLGSIIGKLDFQ